MRIEGLRTKKFRVFLMTGLAACLLLATALNLDLFSGLEARSWDFRLKLVADPARADKTIQLIVIDQASLDYFANQQSITWPWPRALYVPVIKYLESAGAKGLALDMIFSESSVHGVEDDREFVEGLRAGLPIINSASLGQNPEANNNQKLTIFKTLQSKDNLTYVTKNVGGSDYQSATLPIPEIIQVSDAIGVVNATPDADGVFRHYQPVASLQNLPVLGLPLALFHVVNPTHSFSDLSEVVDRQNRLAVNFHGPSNSYPTQNFVDIVNSYIDMQEGRAARVSPARFKDSYVFLGVWAPGLLDLRPTPLDAVYRGVEYNAAVLDNLMHGDFVRKVGAPWTFLYGATFLILTAFLAFYSEGLTHHILVVVGILAGIFTSSTYLASLAIWMPLTALVGVCALTLIASFALQYHLEGRDLKFIRGAFARYVSPAVIEKIVKDPSALALGGERRELTIFFSDIAGFTTISESMDAARLVKLLNIYLTEMTNIILRSGGTLDKYEGDAIIAFWNAPLSVPRHAHVAVSAALDCQAKLAEMREDFKREYGAELYTRIGMHTGTVSVGNFGSHDRFNYTVIGDAANLASRLEGANKNFGTSMLISQATYEGLDKDIKVRPVGSIRVVGRKEPIRVYEPIEAGSFFCDPANLEIYINALAAFERAEFDISKALFARLPDKLSAAYLTRIEHDQTRPAAIWSPVWELKDK